MNLSLRASDLQKLILQRADEIESDFKRHLAATRELEKMPNGYPTVLMAPIEASAAETGDLDQQEKYRQAEQEYRHVASADSIARQVQWMRTVASIIDHQPHDITVSLEELVTLNLWPGRTWGSPVHSSNLRAIL